MNKASPWIAAVLTLLPIAPLAQAPPVGYDDTPMQPNGKWRVHDGKRPQPRRITPGASVGQAPSDAIVLLGPGEDLSRWRMQDGSPITWKVQTGVLESAKGYIQTK